MKNKDVEQGLQRSIRLMSLKLGSIAKDLQTVAQGLDALVEKEPDRAARRPLSFQVGNKTKTIGKSIGKGVKK